MTADASSAPITSDQDLRTIYDQPNPIVLNKVLARFDRHATTFIDAARFAVMNVEGPDGVPTPVLAGGPPGFARVMDEATLAIDVPFDAWPRIDVARGAGGYAVAVILVVPGVKETLRCKGRATVAPATEDAVGAPRMVLRIDNTFFHCAKAFMRSRVWDPPKAPGRWKGLRDFRCVRKVRESAVITSFHFVPADGGAPPTFQPGQHIPLEVGGQGEPLRRSYSLSNRPGEDTIRISVKREAAPAVGSGYLHDNVDLGSIVRMRNPGGRFVLDQGSTRPVVLLSAGVGLTPMVSMLEHLVATGSPRRVWFLHAAISGREHAMGVHLREVARAHGNVRLHVCYDRPRPDDVRGRDYDEEGRLSVDALKRLLPWDDYEFYVCGPVPFMKAMIEDLIGNGVLPDRVRWEAFSADKLDIAISRTPSTPHGGDASGRGSSADTDGATVEFRKSGKVVRWTPGAGTLLELAEAHGVAARFSCRTGGCFTCAARVLSGEVAYIGEMDDVPDDGTALICSAVPAGHLVLDL